MLLIYLIFYAVQGDSALEVEEDILPAGVPPPDEAHLLLLQRDFGHSSFRPMQWKIIHAALQVNWIFIYRGDVG